MMASFVFEIIYLGLQVKWKENTSNANTVHVSLELSICLVCIKAIITGVYALSGCQTLIFSVIHSEHSQKYAGEKTRFNKARACFTNHFNFKAMKGITTLKTITKILTIMMYF